MDSLILKLRLLAKAEMVLFRLALRRTLRQAALALAAVLVAILAAAMLNVALYQYLLPRWDGAVAALAVALADLVVAGALIVLAGRQRLDSEYEAASELREQIIADLATEAGRLRSQVNELQDDIRQIRATASAIVSPGGFNWASVIQGIAVLVKSFRRS